MIDSQTFEAEIHGAAPTAWNRSLQHVPSADSLGTAGRPKPDDETTKLAKATQNPVADLVSLPFQFNFNTGGGFDDGTFFNLNFQPVVPVKGVLKKYTVILRTIVPYLSIPTPAGTR